MLLSVRWLVGWVGRVRSPMDAYGPVTSDRSTQRSGRARGARPWLFTPQR